MQELFINKIHFFKFLSSSGKPWLDRLKLLQCCFSSRGTSVFWRSHWCKQGEILTRKWKYPVLRTNANPQQLIKHTKISYSLTSLVSRDFSRRTYRNGLNRVPQSWSPPSTQKVRTVLVGYLLSETAFYYTHTQGALPQKIICVSEITGHHCAGWI